MGQGREARIAASVGVLALIGQAQALAAADCRRVPVYSAPCFSQIKPHRGCPAIPRARAPCFTVHGRLALYNGTPSFRLLPLRSHRILGVLGGDGEAESPTLLPKGVEDIAKPLAPGAYRDVFGDFRVCPLALARTGWMRPVCIVSARHVTLSIWQNNMPGGRLPTATARPPPPASPAGSRSRLAPG
jgi:hypothetical protein